jgi:hypothetical protein
MKLQVFDALPLKPGFMTFSQNPKYAVLLHDWSLNMLPYDAGSYICSFRKRLDTQNKGTNERSV